MTLRKNKRFLAFVFLLTPFLVALPSSKPTPSQAAEPTRRALLIGINTYLPTGTAPAMTAAKRGKNRGLWSNLDGPVNDVEGLQELLIARFGFKAEHIRTLKNTEATRANILAAIQQQLVEAPAPGDTVLFFYAGHGSQVFNSKSREQDKRDESLVPADSLQGVPDIRDKELDRLFNQALAKGIHLTAIFDSCHSGSIQRGSFPPEEKQRALEPNLEDANDNWQPEQTPEQRGALILSATRDDQPALEKKDDSGLAHGIFTRALLKVLQTVPVNEPVDRVYLRVKALMQLDSSVQEPVLAPAEQRTRRTLFGSEASSLTGLTTVAAVKTRENGEVELQGGRAVGLIEGCTLKSLDDKPVRLEIVATIGLNRCRAKILGEAVSVAPGTLFEVEHWLAPDEATLRLWLPSARLPLAQLQQITASLAPLQAAENVRWLDDPTEITGPQSFYEIVWNGTEWLLRSSGKPSKNLGAQPTAATVLDALPKNAKPALLLRLPPPAELKLQLGKGTDNDSLQLVESPAQADYLLTGRLHKGKIEYAWTRPNLTKAQTENLPLPARTDWLSSQEPQLNRKLEDLMLRCGKVKAWLQLEAPPERRPFPYRLALKHQKTKETKTTGSTVDQEKYDLVLLADREQLQAGAIKPRYVYVFVIDSHGQSQLRYPAAESGNVENRFPVEVAGQKNAAYPQEIPLPAEAIEISAPFGLDTFILITSVDPIPNYADVLNFEGVRRGTDGKMSPLEKILRLTGSATRGTREVVPSEWSIQRVSLQSVPSSPK